MTRLPTNALLKAAARWLDQLDHLSPMGAGAMFLTSPKYRDLTATQYSAALDWLRSVGLVDAGSRTAKWARRCHLRPELIVVEAALEDSRPIWLSELDQMGIDDAAELPEDILDIAEGLGVSAPDVFATVVHVAGVVDTAVRAEVGAAGEAALLRLLTENSDAKVFHAAAASDGYGYDISMMLGLNGANLEVKTTTRRNRLSIYLSRHEFEVMLRDPQWFLVAILLGEEQQVSALGVVDNGWLKVSAPNDASVHARWQSVRFDVPASALRPGLTVAAPWAFDRLPLDHGLKTGLCVGPAPLWLGHAAGLA